MSKYGFITSATWSFVVAACGVGLWAQQPAPENGVPAHMVVTVEPRKGSDVPVVNREDVMVYEGKVRDTVTEWVPAEGDRAALELFVLIDDGSDTNLGTQLTDIRKFITGQPAATKVGVAYMQDGSAKILQDPTSDHEEAAKKLRLPLGMAGINGSPYFSLSDLIKRWPETTARREIVVASDGIDPYYPGADVQDPYLASAIDDAQRAGIMVSAIYTPGAGHLGHDHWQTYWGQLHLSQLADETGGESYAIGFQGPPVSFGPYFDDLTRRMSHQFLLTFLAKPVKKAGLQSVKLRTEVPNADLVSAGRVYVSATP